jgi:hypothetical protein
MEPRIERYLAEIVRRVEEPLGDRLAALWLAGSGGRAHDRGAGVLTACRAWAWAVEGRWLSKRDAAVWASARLADAAPVRNALARRTGRSAPQPTDDELDAILAPVERALTGVTGGNRTPCTPRPTC